MELLVAPVCITTVFEVSCFLTSLLSICYLLSLDGDHSNRCEVVCVSLMISNTELLFTCLLAICIFLFGKCLFSYLPNLIELLVIEESLHLCDKFHLVIVYDRGKPCLS